MNILQFANQSKELLKSNKILRFYKIFNNPWMVFTVMPLLATVVYLNLGFPTPSVIQTDPSESFAYGTFVWQMTKITISMILGMLPVFVAHCMIDFFGERRWREINPTTSLHSWTVKAADADKHEVVKTLMLLKGPQWKTTTEDIQVLLTDSVLPAGWWKEVEIYLKNELSKEKHSRHFGESQSEEQKFEHNRKLLEQRVQSAQSTFKI